MYASSSTSSDNLTPNWTRFSSSSNSQSTTTSATTTQPWEKVTSSSSICQNNAKSNSSTNNSINCSSMSKEYPVAPALKVKCNCYELTDRMFHTHNNISSSSSDHSYRNFNNTTSSGRCACLTNPNNYIKTTNLFHTHDNNKILYPDKTINNLPSSSRIDGKHDIWQDLMLTRSSFVNKYRTAPFDYGSGFHAHHYEPYWNFSSMPEIPATLIDDEFMVDAGIRIPSQLQASTSQQSNSKIPNLQDIIYRKKKMNMNDTKRRLGITINPTTSSSFERNNRGRPFDFTLSKSYSLDYDDGNSCDDRSKSSTSSQNKIHYGFELSSVFVDKDRVKPLHQLKNSSVDIRNKRQPPTNTSYNGLRLTNDAISINDKSQETKLLKFKRHSSVDQPNDYGSNNPTRMSRGSGLIHHLDANHNQGMSKIPVRNSVHVSSTAIGNNGISRTAPVTRTSSPIRVELFDKLGFNKSAESYVTHHDRRHNNFRRYRSSDDEDVDKICQKF